MAFYKGFSEKNKDKRSSFNGILQGLSEKSKVHGDDFKNR
ncbi:hypothetical protein T4D_4782 [Trichinella pseudospiralis]|uniref:Uncharacterized protein n=1 Tax=Trichinella pseudospiralis TaxID=6337 RepID=A0A0V1DMU3_TRIPS|nr:hypothetical protein T4D_2591 [Trichinella pseudospiralis]KRY62782.1 hypothetical protein T4D_4782 [Trichinella pseudospiralis]